MSIQHGHAGDRLLVLQELDRYLDRLEQELSLAHRLESHGDRFEAAASALARRKLDSNQRLQVILVEERQAVARALPPDLVERYQRLRGQLPPPWVVSVADGRCGACNHKLAPGQLPTQLAQPPECPSCHRLLVLGWNGSC